MRRISAAALYDAIPNSGGLGAIEAGNSPPELIDKAIDKYREPFGRLFAPTIMLLSDNVETAVLVAKKRFMWCPPSPGTLKISGDLERKNGIKIIPVVPVSARAFRIPYGT